MAETPMNISVAQADLRDYDIMVIKQAPFGETYVVMGLFAGLSPAQFFAKKMSASNPEVNVAVIGTADGIVRWFRNGKRQMTPPQ